MTEEYLRIDILKANPPQTADKFSELLDHLQNRMDINISKST